MSFKIYKGATMVVEGASPLAIMGIAPNTNVATGDYQVVRVENGKESAKVDIPSFKTLPIAVTGVTLAPKTLSGTEGTAGSGQLTHTVAPAGATNKAVTYSVAPTTAGLAVTNAGLVSWTDTVPAGAYTVTVKTTDQSKTDTAILTIAP